MAARIVKADPIIAVDILSKRLKLAKELGATAVVNARRSDVLTSVGRLVPEGMDYALETTGHPVMMRAAAHVTSRRGTTAYFTGDGIPDFVPKGKKAVAVIAGDSVPHDFIPRMIQWHRSGKFPFDRLIRFYDFKDIQRAIKDSLTGKTIKPVLCMP
jgi:aryl-alcohol dehydrogenase